MKKTTPFRLLSIAGAILLCINQNVHSAEISLSCYAEFKGCNSGVCKRWETVIDIDTEKKTVISSSGVWSADSENYHNFQSDSGEYSFTGTAAGAGKFRINRKNGAFLLDYSNTRVKNPNYITADGKCEPVTQKF